MGFIMTAQNAPKGQQKCWAQLSALSRLSLIFVGPLRWNLAKRQFRRSHGLYASGGQVLHVSAGIGYVFLPFRLGCPSEITLLELRRSRPAAA